MEIPSAGLELFHAYRQTDGPTEGAVLIGALHPL
jgi:hypothetical protein